MATGELKQLMAVVRDLRRQGRVPEVPTREQRIDWAYGNAVIENPLVTRDMVERAVDAQGNREG